MKTNQMKLKLQTGEKALGCSIMVPSPQTVEMVGHAGFDWVLIDMEHGTIDIETAELMIMAAEAVDITPIVRPKTNNKEDISRVLDRGAMGVQVPHVNNLEDAQKAVAAVKFGLGDSRSIAAGTRPDSYGLSKSMNKFMKFSNEQSLVCVQLEHTAAIENVDQILETEDVDVFFIGPSDLSQSMGYPGNPKAKPVKDAIEDTLRKITSAGKIPGMTASMNNLDAVLDSGVKYIYIHLPKLIGVAASEFLKKASS